MMIINGLSKLNIVLLLYPHNIQWGGLLNSDHVGFEFILMFETHIEMEKHFVNLWYTYSLHSQLHVFIQNCIMRLWHNSYASWQLWMIVNAPLLYCILVADCGLVTILMMTEWAQKAAEAVLLLNLWLLWLVSTRLETSVHLTCLRRRRRGGTRCGKYRSPIRDRAHYVLD